MTAWLDNAWAGGQGSGGGFRAGVRGLWGFSRLLSLRCLARRETREHSRHYLQALLVQSGERRNAENLSETVPASARGMQRFLAEISLG